MVLHPLDFLTWHRRSSFAMPFYVRCAWSGDNLRYEIRGFAGQIGKRVAFGLLYTYIYMYWSVTYTCVIMCVSSLSIYLYIYMYMYILAHTHTPIRWYSTFSQLHRWSQWVTAPLSGWTFPWHLWQMSWRTENLSSDRCSVGKAETDADSL